MKVNGWELENGRAAFRGRDDSIALVNWVEDVPAMVEEIRESGLEEEGRLSEMAWDGETFRPGLYLRMALEGRPVGIIMLPPECGGGVEEFARENPAEEFLQEMLAMREQCRVVSREMEPEELASWLRRAEGRNCPGRDRFLAAMREIDRMVQENPGWIRSAPYQRDTAMERDVSSAVSWRLGIEFQAQGAALLAAHGDDPDELGRFLGEAALAGDTHLTMGVMVRQPMPGGEECGYGVGMVARDPDWMGMFPILDRARGLEATLAPSRVLPGHAGVIALTDSSAGSDARGQDRPEAVALIDLLEANGLIQARWQD